MLPTAKYPFITDLSKADMEDKYRFPIETLLEEDDSVRLARERLDYIIKKNIAPLAQAEASWDNILAFHATLAAAAKSGSLRLLYKVADAEAKRVRLLLQHEGIDWLVRIAKAMGIDAAKEELDIPWLVDSRGQIVIRRLVVSVPASTYLKVASSLGDPRWRLVNSFLLGGRVYLGKSMFEELLSFNARSLILSLAEKYRDLELPKLESLGREFASRLDRERVEEGYDPSRVPACVQESLSRIAGGKAGPLDLYLAATFLANVGAPVEVLAEAIFSGGYADAFLARIIAEVFMEEARAYTPPRCKVLLEAGVCKECRGTGPLSEYYSRRRRRGRGCRIQQDGIVCACLPRRSYWRSPPGPLGSCGLACRGGARPL